MDEGLSSPQVPSGEDDLSPERWGGGGRSQPKVKRFLAGPQRPGSELLRVCRIAGEFIRGFWAMRAVGPCVTVFGSARFRERHRYYRLARQIGARLAQEGFTVLTGGGPDIMEAANRGAREVGGRSAGCNIELPHEQSPNAYVDRFVEFRHFFVRKVMLVKYSYGFVILPGGFGTLDEVFETAMLMQTDKIAEFPMVLMGADYWSPLLDFMRHKMVGTGTIDAHDPERLFLTDSPEKAVEHIKRIAMPRFGLVQQAPLQAEKT